MENLVKEFVVCSGAIMLYGLLCWIAWKFSKLISNDHP